jgi:hypothetical protein
LFFRKPEDMFAFVLRDNPSIVAIGESHALRGDDEANTVVAGFSRWLLPLLASRTSEVLLELWAPDARCQTEVKSVARRQQPVGELQSVHAKDAYVALAGLVRSQGIVPSLLEPTCDDFRALADAGSDTVDAMLRLVARLSKERARILAARPRPDSAFPRKFVLLYGGALHNDIDPLPGREAYAFGRDLAEATQGHYVELDLFRPESVGRSPFWKGLRWYEAWSRLQAPSDVWTVFVTGNRSYTVLFPSRPGPTDAEGQGEPKKLSP